MKIAKFNKTSDIEVEFQDEYKYKVKTTYQNFKRGVVTNPYSRTVYGTGYIGIGRHPTHIDKKNTKAYATWTDILRRCYYDKERYLHPAYIDCVVCEEWLNYQNFAEWFENNYYDLHEGRMHIDKDVLGKDEKIYCPKNCIFLPQRINMIFMSKSRKSSLPNGVVQNSTGSYIAYYNGKKYNTYAVLEDAVAEHSRQKRIHIKNVVDLYGDKLPQRVIEALLTW